MGVSPECVTAVVAGSGGKLTDQEAADVIRAVEGVKKRIQAEGKIARADEELRRMAGEVAADVKIAAALQRKQAALNVIKRKQVETFVEAYVAKRPGKYRDALLSYLEGSNRQIEGARKSVAATAQAYENWFSGNIMGRIAKEKPHLEKMLGDEAFNALVTREMEAPGSTGSADAKWLGALYSETADLARRILNDLGANIGKLDGWRPQTHDAWRLLRAGRTAWVRSIMGRLDMERTFPDAAPDDVPGILSGIYDTVVTGMDEKPSAREKGERTGPANLAKKLGESRVLHFKSSDDWLAYNKEFGFGNLSASMFQHLRRSAKIAGQMELLGPNPEAMLGGLVESLRRDLKGQLKGLEGKKLKRATDEMDALLNFPQSSAWAIMTGRSSSPTNYGFAQAASAWRAWQMLSKLGGAVISATSDPVILINNLRFNGKPFVQAWGDVFSGYLRGRGKGEKRQVAFLLGEGFDGIIQNHVERYAIMDSAPGMIQRGATKFFRWTGLTGLTDTGRSVAAQVMAADFGRLAGKGFDKLPARYRMALERQGIGPAKWEAMRQTAWKGDNGTTYITPDRFDGIADDVLETIAPDRFAKAREAIKDPARLEARLNKLRDEVRRELTLDMHRFISDEARFGIVEVDAASRRLTTGGTRPGTLGGEAIRALMQFKGFPIAFSQRVLGRAMFAGPEGLARHLHTGEMMAGLLVAGLFAMWGKDIARGATPRELWGDEGLNMKTLTAAMVQSGGAGIYGDFLFNEVNRYSGGLLQTAAGPAFGEAFGLAERLLRAKDGDFSAGEWVNSIVGNIPFQNFWITKAALDTLLVNSIKEAFSPGYIRRKEKRMREYGQEPILPLSVWE